jgi:hypothetical protein
MWKTSLHPYLSIHKTDSSAFLPVIINLPNALPSIHIAIYLPIAGKETAFMTELAKPQITLEELHQKYTNAVVFIRGDANSSRNNHKRFKLISNFCSDHSLSRVSLSHMTYHHFTEQGSSDSDLDVLLFSNQKHVNESLLHLRCQQDDPLVDSHHDVLVSKCTIPCVQPKNVDTSLLVTAPIVENNRHRIIWSREGIDRFEEITSKLLPEIRQRWSSSS